MMLRLLLVLLSTFAANAQIDLNEIRQNIPTYPRKPIDLNDAMTSRPDFMPLCGNGRIDTSADYAAYYASNRSALRLTRRQIMYMYTDLPSPDQIYQVFFSANETCDDGNRVDFDGCSADCMYLDLWTPPCELAVDLKLEFEDMMYDTVRESMIVSARTGIYALEMGLDDTYLTARILAGKDFTATSMVRHSTSLLLFSPEQKTLWRLSDEAGAKLTPLNKFERMRNTSSNIGGVHVNPNGSCIVYNSESMAYLTDLASDGYNVCVFGSSISSCIFLFYIPDQQYTAMFACNFLRVQIGPTTCQVYPNEAQPSQNIWKDIFERTSYEGATIHMQPVGSFTVLPADLNASPEFAVKLFHAMGGFIEGTIASSRKFGSMNGSADPGIFYSTGDSSRFMDMMMISQTCGRGKLCIFDTDCGFDAFALNPFKNAIGKNWNDVLQEKIFQAAPPIANLTPGTEQYDRLLISFAATFRNMTKHLLPLAVRTHPITQNTWAIRRNQLIEISKSGVQLRRADERCVPSGIALCGRCQWAPNGRKCQSCATAANVNAWAWRVQCQNMTCDDVSSKKRALLAQDDRAAMIITFILSGNTTKIFNSWPSLNSDVSSGFTTIRIPVVNINDPATEMRQIQLKLLSAVDDDVQVVTRPYITRLVREPTGAAPEPPRQSLAAPTTDNSNILLIVLGIAIPCVLVLVLYFILALYWCRNGHAHYKAVPHS